MKETYLDYHYTHFMPESEWIFVTPGLESQQLQIVAQELGHFKYDGTSYTERGPLSSYQIFLSYTNTSGLIRVHDTDFPYIGLNEICFLDCTGGYRTETKGYADAAFVHFWGENVGYYYALFSQMNSGSPLVQGYSSVVHTNIHRLLEMYKLPNSFLIDVHAEMLIMEMIADLIRMVTPHSQNNYSKYVESAISVIGEHYAEDLSLDYVANAVHISKYYLSHIFKKETGLTLSNFLQQFRLGKAKELLRTTHMSQEAICSQVGIYNSSYLNKLFRLYENSTPNAYRKKWR